MPECEKLAGFAAIDTLASTRAGVNEMLNNSIRLSAQTPISSKEIELRWQIFISDRLILRIVDKR